MAAKSATFWMSRQLGAESLNLPQAPFRARQISAPETGRRFVPMPKPSLISMVAATYFALAPDRRIRLILLSS